MSTANNQVKSQTEILEASKATEAAEKAEFRQALMSLFIPLSLFVACCIFAAGVFMVYYDEPAGWGFIGVTVVLALSGFLALFTFQNKFRARGIIPARDAVVESNFIDASPEVCPTIKSQANSGSISKAGPREDIKQTLATDLSTVSAVKEGQGQGMSDTAGDALQPNPTRSDKTVATSR
jgi:hypothetical protein